MSTYVFQFCDFQCVSLIVPTGPGHKDIPVLNDYSKMQDHTYWKNFPFRELPEKPYTKINTEKLAYLLNERRHLMTECEWGRG